MLQTNEIRVLDLWPHGGTEDAPLRCSFRVVKLVDRPKYEALSYVWGDLSDQVPVSVIGDDGDEAVNITHNLHAALSRLRLRDNERSLWIDQLCINQHDNAEKMTQIVLMRDIYSGCSCCILWMGDLSPGISAADADKTIELIQYLARVKGASDRDDTPAPSWLGSFTELEGSMKALGFICPGNNAWWERAWTLQEGILPSNVVFQFGYLSLSWRMVKDALGTWHTKLRPVLYSLRTDNEAFVAQSSQNKDWLLSNMSWFDDARKHQDPLVHGVIKWRSRKATLPHDNVFALMGLWPAETFPRSTARGYDIPIDEFFCAFAADMIMHTQNLQPLMSNPRLEDDAATPGIARWAIDMVQETRLSSIEWRHVFCHDWYHADDGRQLDSELLRKTWLDNPKILGLKGFLADEIQGVYAGLTWEGSIYKRPKSQLLEKLRNWADVAGVRNYKGGPDQYCGCGYTRHEAFGRLMLGDLIREL